MHSLYAAVKGLKKSRLRRLFDDERFSFRTDSNENQPNRYTNPDREMKIKTYGHDSTMRFGASKILGQ